MLDDSSIKLKIEDRYVKMEKDPDEPECDGDNIQLHADQLSYREQRFTDDSENVTKNYDQKSLWNREVFEQIQGMMRESSKKSELRSTANRYICPYV